MTEDMKKVVVTKSMVGLFAMQVCAAEDATHDEILEVCNRENPAGTENGWAEVVGKDYDFTKWVPEKAGPVACEDHPNRIHYLVLC